ncbi:hypothetical protein E2562_030424 [Oryza meyeriana var. granulata]|uniref:Cathepsin propeptide inhibitor domain-containing protein n=1 Tax=Oryza meyeriana var. granulata TaxID=110450 RepID=A0A6G1FE42_9ORYZ|nr:hypothetical protein E2562_030424 [Oryza meyeriana var. granulata]
MEQKYTCSFSFFIKQVKHRKIYASPKEKVKRYEIFKQNLRHIVETNRRNGSYWLGLNQFADVAHEEFKTEDLKH